MIQREDVKHKPTMPDTFAVITGPPTNPTLKSNTTSAFVDAMVSTGSLIVASKGRHRIDGGIEILFSPRRSKATN
jgi:hypothetical protein